MTYIIPITLLFEQFTKLIDKIFKVKNDSHLTEEDFEMTVDQIGLLILGLVFIFMGLIETQIQFNKFKWYDFLFDDVLILAGILIIYFLK